MKFVFIGMILGWLIGILLIMEKDERRHREFSEWLNDPVAMQRLGSKMQGGATVYISGRQIGKKK